MSPAEQSPGSQHAAALKASQLPDSQGTEKRRRTRGPRPPSHQACVACKARKVRCDAVRPTCAYCNARNIDCVYPPAFKRASCSAAHVASLESRLSELEDRARQSEKTTYSENASSSNGLRDLTEIAGTPHEPLLQPQEHHLNAQHDSASFDADGASFERRGALLSIHAASGSDAPLLGENADQDEHQASATGIYDQGQILDSDIATDGDGPVAESNSENERAENIPLMDGMVEYQDASAKDRDSSPFYGTTSTFHFAMNVKASAIDEDGELGRGPRLARGEPANTRLGRDVLPSQRTPQPHTYQDSNSGKFSLSCSQFQYLPQRHVANSLFERYFTAVNPVWPFLLEDTTRRRYEDTWSADGPTSEIWSAQLNLIFALGFEFWDEDITTRLPSRSAVDVGKEFYMRARTFVLENAFNMSTIGMVQALLLMVQYQQGTMQSEQCWLTIGHATRMALGLGLHKPEKPVTSMSLMERELRNRLWWGCFSLDRVSSMIYGRPTGIHFSHAAKHQHNFPQAVDDQYITLGQNQPDNKPSIYAFFHHVVRMYYVVDDVLGLLYGVNRGEVSDPGCGNNEPRCQIDDCRRFKAPSTLSAIIDIDHSLLSWHDSVPGYLRFSIDTSHSDDGQDMIIQRQKNILRYRFLSIRTLLHRQTLLYLLQSPERREWFQDSPHLPTPSTAAHSLLSERGLRSPFESSFTHISARLCVCSAELLIEAVSAGRPLNLAGAWWWDFYFLFNSLCVIFGAMGLQGTDLAAIIPDTSRTTRLVERGLENIHALAVIGGPKASQSEKFLRQLMAAAIRSAKKRAHADAAGMTGKEVHFSGQTGNIDPTTGQPSPSASWPSETRRQNRNGEDPVDISNGIHNQMTGPADWLLDLTNVPFSWDNLGMDLVDGSPLDSNSAEAIFQGSFDLWDTINSMPGLNQYL